MKKITFICSALFVLAAVSCTKDRTCTCTSTSTMPGTSTSVTTITIVDAKKGDAKNACVKTTRTAGGYTFTDDCQLD